MPANEELYEAVRLVDFVQTASAHLDSLYRLAMTAQSMLSENDVPRAKIAVQELVDGLGANSDIMRQLAEQLRQAVSDNP